ncbi:MAG: hypothetical protein GXO75_04990 [Calditrichaeota bacterium]|nr:hypothetical protein [Calditrichota bacterium]
MKLIQNLKWRYATKQFDGAKKVSQDRLDKESRAKLKSAYWNQSQITEASHYACFCNNTQISDNHGHDFLRLKS